MSPRSSARFDAILVDLYNSAGPAETNEAFWSALPRRADPGRLPRQQLGRFFGQPGGPADGRDALDAAARARGLAPIYVTRRGFRDNLVQYVPTEPEMLAGSDYAALAAVLAASCASAIRPIAAAASSKTAS